MTAREICEKAFTLLGYTDRLGRTDGDTFSPQYKSSLTVCNTIMNEIQRKEGRAYTRLSSLDDEVDLSETSLNEVMPFGVAMHYAIIDSDDSMQSTFAELYTRKLGVVPRIAKTVTLKYSPME